ncbi:MAG: YqeG family HAD IIIA-type phosphatase [Coriobacteriia bacterium]|nr:YqeG family HAD IIIA-type phosphatase [Coriobacteriia bacterium]
MLNPDLYHRSVLDIDLAALAAQGIDTLLIDLDNTLVPRDSAEIPAEVKAWALALPAAGFSACIVSNNWHERVCKVAEELGMELVAKAVKPLPFAFYAAFRRMGCSRASAVIIGDQLFTDVLGGKLVGIKTILIAPISSADLPHTLFLRKVERVLLAGRTPLP